MIALEEIHFLNGEITILTWSEKVLMAFEECNGVWVFISDEMADDSLLTGPGLPVIVSPATET